MCKAKFSHDEHGMGDEEVDPIRPPNQKIEISYVQMTVICGVVIALALAAVFGPGIKYYLF